MRKTKIYMHHFKKKQKKLQNASEKLPDMDQSYRSQTP